MNITLLMDDHRNLRNLRNRRRNSKKPGLAALIITTILLASCPGPGTDPVPDPVPSATLATIELHADNGDPQDIWSDGSTMYVSDNTANKLFAYRLRNGSRDESKEFDLHADNTDPRGIWSNANMTPPPANPTIWVIDPGQFGLFAYTDGTFDADKSFPSSIAVGNNHARGIWANGTTMWAVDRGRPFLFAYLFTETGGGARLQQDSDNQASNLPPDGNTNDTGVWSDGTTMWILSEAGQIYAYTLNTIGTTPVRETDKEFTSLATGNTTPLGIWSDGTTMWVLDGSEKIYAYNLETKQAIPE